MEKYQSINNHYKKEVESFLNKNPNYKNGTFIAQEKYDGANFQLIFTKMNPPQYASRNHVLDVKTSNFFGFQNTINSQKYQDMIHRICELVNYFGTFKKYNDKDLLYKNIDEIEKINLFGELYGNVQKRIDYKLNENCSNELIFFDVMIDGVMMDQEFFYNFCNLHNIPSARYFLINETIDACLDFDVENKNIEGIVIKPYGSKFCIGSHKFFIKKKVEKFEERTHTKREFDEKKENATMSEASTNKLCLADKSIFKSYLTKNRVLSVMSKQDYFIDHNDNINNKEFCDIKLFEQKDFCDLVRRVYNDAIEDFKSDYPNTKIPKFGTFKQHIENMVRKMDN